MTSKTLSQLARAAENALGIDIVVVGRSAYHYADETSEWFALTRADLAYATDCAEAYPSPTEAYSHWCAGAGRPATAAEIARLEG